MTTPVIVTGDDIDFSVTLQLAGSAASFNVGSPQDTIKARLVSLDRKRTYTEEATLDPSAVGADWANGVVIVEMAASATDGVTYQGPAYCEIQVDDGSLKDTWFVDVDIARGNIA